MTRIDDLSRIYIRAQVDGKWGSYSLAELPFQDVLDWAMSKVIPEAHDDEKHRKAALVYLLETLGVPVVKAKRRL